jgi:hypothetical protein
VPLHMFVRFRQSRSRLQASLIETRRTNGKVRNEHIASLGSVETPATVASRLAFWQRLHARLAKLSNRVDAATQGKILSDIHARIPMVTIGEQRALQLENAEADAKLWSALQNFGKDQVTGHREMAATAERAIATGEAELAKTSNNVAVAQDRVERIKRGEEVHGGLGEPPTREDFERELIKAGFTKSQLRRCRLLGELHQELGDLGWDEFLQEMHRARDQAVTTVARKMLRNKRSS